VAYLKFIEQLGNFECFMAGRIRSKRSCALWNPVSRASDCDVSTELDGSQLLVPAEKRKANKRMVRRKHGRLRCLTFSAVNSAVVEVVF
jgi:hypothetical protein